MISQRIVVLACSVMFAASLGLVALGISTRAAASHDTCVQVEGLKKVISGQLNRATLTLPALDYYKHHPAELRQQLRLIDEQRAEFRQHACS